jgi:hypothetical protein
MTSFMPPGRGHKHKKHIPVPKIVHPLEHLAVAPSPPQPDIVIQRHPLAEPLVKALDSFSNLSAYMPIYERLDSLHLPSNPHAVGDYWLPSAERIVGVPTALEQSAVGDWGGTALTTTAAVTDASGTVRSAPVFIKRAHILDPFHYMQGKYVMPSHPALPAHHALYMDTLRKINNPLNEAYTDALANFLMSRLVEQGVCPHFVRFYGSFCAIADEHHFNITGHFEDLRADHMFRDNVGQLFEIQHVRVGGIPDIDACDLDNPRPVRQVADTEEAMDDIPDIGLSPALRPTATAAAAATTDLALEDVLDLPMDDTVVADTRRSSHYYSHDGSRTSRSGKDSIVSVHDSEEDWSSSDNGSDSGSDSDNGSGSDSGSEDSDLSNLSDLSTQSSSDAASDETEPETLVKFKNYPVLLTVMDRVAGDTMASLLDDPDIGEEQWTAYIFQVILSLCVMQKHYGCIHNDLHVNNVMFEETEEPYLYYRLAPTVFVKVPTFGRIMKIIDFGRATFSYKGEAFVNDAFESNNDAGSQYNTEPYYNPERARVDPNPSFDLSRLATSIMPDLYMDLPETATPRRKLAEEKGKIYWATVSPLFNLMMEWITDTSGRNILWTPRQLERYPDFDLYKVIARRVNNAVPIQQLKKPLFAGYYIAADAVPADAKVWPLDLFA